MTDGVELPKAASVAVNPSQDELRSWVADMPSSQKTEFGNWNVTCEVTARQKRSTFFVADHDIGQARMSRADFERMAGVQDEHIAGRDMVLVEGYIGPDPEHRTGCRLFIERSNSNIAAMQQQLWFPKDQRWEPELTVIYTPTLVAEGWPGDRLIAVDLDHGVTRVFNSDYFGESKMGGLRMWNKLVYDEGGLALHAGCKVFPAGAAGGRDDETLALIIGLSGTGKTTTTFRRQLGSLPVQDDFCGLFPGGVVRATESGCFAKTYGLDPDDEPTIHQALTTPDSWLENVGVAPDGTVDFFDDCHTANGRGTFPLDDIEHRSPRDLPPARYLFILNRNENVIPAVARLPRELAAGYFMLGETKGTSAGGAAEAGKSLRVPGTNPFFFGPDELQANRLLELVDTMPDLEVFLLNTGRVGGPEDHDGSKKVRIAHSSAVIEGIVTGSIDWEPDPDFGYQVARSVPGIDDVELLQPRRLYERQGRTGEYEDRVRQLQEERREYLAGFPALRKEIAQAITG